MIEILDGSIDLAEIVAMDGPLDLFEGAVYEIGVVVVVDVDQGVGAEVDGIGTGGEGAVVLVGIEDLDSEGFPAAGGAAVEEAAPPFAEALELRFDVRNQLVGKGIAIGPDAGRVDGVGVVDGLACWTWMIRKRGKVSLIHLW